MNTPRQLIRGQRLSAAYLNRMRAAAVSGANAIGGPGVNVRQLDGSTQIALANHKTDPALCIPCKYSMNVAEWRYWWGPAPQFGLVRFTDGYEGNQSLRLGACGAPDLPGLGRSLGVLQEYAADGATVMVQTTGVTPVLYNSREGIAQKGDRLGNQCRFALEGLSECDTGEQYLAYPNPLGPLTVISDLGSARTFDGYGENYAYYTRWALCNITGARGSTVAVDWGDGTTKHFYTLFFRNGLAVNPLHTEVYPGCQYVQPVFGGNTTPQPSSQTVSYAAGTAWFAPEYVNVIEQLGQIAEVWGAGSWTLTDGGDGVLIIDYAHAATTTAEATTTEAATTTSA